MLEDSKTLWRVSKEASLLVPHFTGEKTDEKRSPLCCLIPAGQLTSPTGIKPKQLELRCSRVAEAGPGRGDTGPLRCRTSGDAARSLAKGWRRGRSSLFISLFTLHVYVRLNLKKRFFHKFCHCLCAQSCPALCDPMNCSPPGSSVHGILQARILEWVAISSSGGSSQPRDWTHVPCLAGRFFNPAPPGKYFNIIVVGQMSTLI